MKTTGLRPLAFAASICPISRSVNPAIPASSLGLALNISRPRRGAPGE
jgi:hypothetical protein